MTCWSFMHRASAYLDGELLVNEQAEMDAHAEICPQCQELVNGLKRVSAELKKLDVVEPDREFENRLLSRVYAAQDRVESRRWRGWLAFAACAVLAGTLGMAAANSKSNADERHQAALESELIQEQDLIYSTHSDPLCGGPTAVPASYGQ
jgi:anti-sigma factor RsiW